MHAAKVTKKIGPITCVASGEASRWSLYPLNMTNCPCCSASYDTGWNSLAGCSASLGSGAPAHRQMRGTVKAPGLAHKTFLFISWQIIGWIFLLKCILESVPSCKQEVTAPVIFLLMGSCSPGISATSARSSLLGISCSNTFSIDSYQRLCLQSECGRARENKSWHRMLQRASVGSYCQWPSQTNWLWCSYTIPATHTYEKALQAVTHCTSTSLLIWQVCRCSNDPFLRITQPHKR